MRVSEKQTGNDVRLGRPHVHGQAASRRDGDVFCEYHGGDTVKIGGRVAPYLHGVLSL